ncbi:S24 family peptidase [Roseibacillus ishigakijimensis]|nr:S24 family peptidase [Roseibacillus ishigakijimensis]
MAEREGATSYQIRENRIAVEMTDQEFDLIENAANIVQTPFRDFVLRAAIARARQEMSVQEANITPLRPRQSAHLMAAAGSPISAEVLEEMDDSGIIRVQISGLSMEPKLHDGDIIEMRHKSKARSHFMKKGLIYLVEVEGGYAVKRYNTRKAREDEQDAEYLTPTGSVGVLESINPEFEPIDITCPVEWVAWLEEQ